MASMLTNFMMPATLGALAPSTSSAKASTAGVKTYADSSTGSSSSTSNSADSLGATFLSLLAQELQHQDPTAPVDPTQMVGQMISLNQLQQLISINQTLTKAADTTSTATGQAKSYAAAPAAVAAADSASTSAAGAANRQLPFDPNTMMPLGFANSGAAAASINSFLNPTSMGLSGSTNTATGGK